jgi:hypothetical protein
MPYRSMWQEYYKEEVTEVEPPKGNYTSVALCRSTGTFWARPTITATRSPFGDSMKSVSAAA